MPGGALQLIEPARSTTSTAIFGLHCDPSLDVGQVGLREGPLTGAADPLEVRLTGSGGHTSRPHLTEDLTFALGKLITELPAVLSPPARPACRRQRGLGHGPRGLGRQRDPARRRGRRHRADARRGGLGRRGARWSAS